MNLSKSSLPLMVAAALGMAACNDPPSLGGSAPLQAANSNPTGSTSDPAPASTCKASTNASGLPCKICVDSSGSLSYDDCGGGGAGGDTGGSGGTSGATVKCLPTTDPTSGAACKTCYAADGSVTTDTCSGGAGGAGGTGTGGTGATVKCAETTDPTTGAACKTCYAADGSITSDSCPGAGSGGAGGTVGSGGVGGSGATCVAAPNIETGQICKVCSDSVSGKLLFVDCGPAVCPPATAAPPPPPDK